MRISIVVAVAVAMGMAANIAVSQQPSQLTFASDPFLLGDHAIQPTPATVPSAPVVGLAVAPPTEDPANGSSRVMLADDLSPQPASDDPADVVAMNSPTAAASAPSVPVAPNAASGECTSQCESAPDWYITTGVEATFLWTRASDAAGGFPDRNELSATNFTTIDNQWDVAPRLWLGFENDCGWGIRGRYWRFSASDEVNNVTVGPPILFPTSDITADSTLDAWAADLELVRHFDRCCWQFLGTVGVRYADLQRDEGFTRYSTVDDTFASTDSTRSVHGTGLTGSLEARRPINDCGFGFFASARGSVLFGSDEGTGTGVIAAGGSHAVEFVDILQNNPLYIEEAQVGVDWMRHLECINGWGFARLAFEYQRWDSSETPFNFSQSVGGVHEFGRSISSDVSFTGVAFSVGFTR